MKMRAEEFVISDDIVEPVRQYRGRGIQIIYARGMVAYEYIRILVFRRARLECESDAEPFIERDPPDVYQQQIKKSRGLFHMRPVHAAFRTFV